ncbi:MAG: CHASE2 domain-containing protein [bacterium]|nr:CHASE2 domain-containing protein [bacterium]
MSNLLTRFLRGLDFRRFPRKKRIRFYINISLAVFVAAGMHLVEHNTQWGRTTLDTAYDTFIKKDAANTPMDPDTGQLVVVDLDHQRPPGPISYISPRNKIAHIINTARQGKAKLVVLDIHMETADNTSANTNPATKTPSNDQLFRTALLGFPKTADFTTQIIFARRFKTERIKTKTGTLKIVAKPIRHYFAQEIEANANFHYAVPTMLGSPADAVVRYWKSHQPGTKEVNWSLPVKTAALAHNAGKRLDQTGKQLSGPAEGLLEIRDADGGTVFELPLSNKDVIRQRIRFRILPADVLGAIHRGTALPAGADNLTPGQCTGKILLVGASHPDRGDSHYTPVGHMPGLYVQANAIDTVLNRRQYVPPALWLALLFDFFVILVAAYVFHHFTKWPYTVIAAVVMAWVLAFVTYNVVYRLFGVFLNAAFAVLASGVFDFLANIEEYLEERKSNGHKKAQKAQKKKNTKRILIRARRAIGVPKGEES